MKICSKISCFFFAGLFIPVMVHAIEVDYKKLSAVSTVGINGRFVGFSTEIERGYSFRHVFNLGTMRLDDERLANLIFNKIEPSWHEFSLTFGMEHNNKSRLELRHLGKITNEIDWSATPGEMHNVFGFLRGGLWLTGGKNGLMEVYNTQGDKLAVLEGHTGTMTSLAYNEKWLVSGDSQGLMALWDLNEITAGKKKIKPYLSMAFSRDNEWVLWSDEGIFSASEKGHLLFEHKHGAASRNPELLSKKVGQPQLYQKRVAAEFGNDKTPGNSSAGSILEPGKEPAAAKPLEQRSETVVR